MKAPKVEFENFTFEESRYRRGSNIWYATTLMRAVKEQKLEPFDYPLAAANLSILGFKVENNDDFCWHVKRVLNADYSKPIIIDDHGEIADGYHRIIHAIIDGKAIIKAYRLKYMPPVDCNEQNNEDR